MSEAKTSQRLICSLTKLGVVQTIVPKQEKDGSWWDYPLYDYHQPYGTAFALMTLIRCRE